MRTMYAMTHLSIVRYEGTIEAVQIARQFGDGALVEYARINEGREGIQILQNFPVGNAIESYLKSDTNCVLYAVSWGGKRIMPVAIKIGSIRIYDRVELQRLAAMMRRQLLLIWGTVAAAGLLMTVLVLFIYVGLPLLVWAMWKLKKNIPRCELPLADLERVLTADGWVMTRG